MKLDKYTVGKRYGKALFELAVEEQQTDVVYADLQILNKVYQEVPDLGNILSDVRLDLDEKREVMDNLAKGFDDGLFKNFLEVVYRYNRMADMPLIIEEFDRLYDEKQRVVSGTVTTAIPLDSQQKQRLEEQLALKLGYETAHLEEKVDAAIMGGVIIEANHQVIDGSVKTRLESLRNRIKQIR